MRKYTKNLSWVLWLVIFSFVGTIFLVWGRGGQQSRKEGNMVAYVYEQPISYGEFYQFVNLFEDQYRQMYGENFEKIRNSFNFQEMALNELIDKALYLEEARKRNIDITPAALNAKITSIPQFQENGVFSMNKYRMLIKSSPMRNVSIFEQYMRDSMKIERVQASLKNMVKVSREEVRAEYTRKTERRTVKAIMFRSVDFKPKVKVDDEILTKYFKDSEDKYFIPDKVKVNYIFLDLNKLKNNVQVTDEMVEDYYNNHLDNYQVPEKVRASHVLLKVQQNADEETVKKIENQIKEIKKEIENGLSFSEAAKKYSHDPQSAKNGGDLGFFGKGEMVPSFEEAAFSLNPGEISDPVRSPFGFHIIKVVKKQPAKTTPLKEIKNQIIQKLKTNIAEEEAEKLIEDIDNRLFDEEPDLKKIADTFHIKYGHTGFFAVNEPIEGIQYPGEIAKIAFQTELNEISEYVKTPAGYYIVSPVELQKQHPATFEEVKDKVKSDYILEMSKNLAKNKAESVLEKILEKGWEPVVKEMKLKEETSAPFGRGGYITSVGKSEEINDFVFKHDVGDVGPVVAINGNYYVFIISDKTGFDPNNYEQEYDLYYTSLLSQKQEKYLGTWIEQQKDLARGKNKIEIYHDVTRK